MENLALVSVSMFQTGKPDKNGLLPVILSPVAGKIPLKRIIPGTLAANSNFKPGEIYLITWLIAGQDEYGERISYTNLGKVPLEEIIGLSEKLGKPEIINSINSTVTNQLPAEL